MYRASVEFTFQLNLDGHLSDIVGQLIFKGKELNGAGSLHTEEEMEKFGTALNTSIALPNIWTLEQLARALYENVKPLFSNLVAINLYIRGAEQRVVEYESDSVIDLDSTIDLPEVVA